MFCLGVSVLKCCMFLWESMQCRSNFTGFQHVKDGLVYRITSDCPYWNLYMLLYIQGIITLEPQTSVYIGIPCTVMLTNFEITFWTLFRFGILFSMFLSMYWIWLTHGFTLFYFKNHKIIQLNSFIAIDNYHVGIHSCIWVT